MTVRLCARIALPIAAALFALALSRGNSEARPESALRDVPIAVTAVTREQIQQSNLAIDVMSALNAVRVNPSALSTTMGPRPRLRGVGPRDWNETRTFLNGQQPVPALSYSPALSDIALIQARDIGRTGAVGHQGSDGSTPGSRARGRGIVATVTAEELSFGQTKPADVILQLIVDAGQPNKPHRKDIFLPMFTQVGVGCAPHSKFGQVCVITLSNPFMVPPPPISLPPATPGFNRFNCPTGLFGSEVDAFRSWRLGNPGDAGAGATSNRPYRVNLTWREDVAAANQTAYQALTNPDGLNLGGVPRLDLPRNQGLGFGYCAPRSALGDDALVHPRPAPKPNFEHAPADYTAPEGDERDGPGPE